MRSIATLASGIALLAGAASATTLDAHFDLRAHWWETGYGLQSSFMLEDNGLTATFSGRYFNPANVSGNSIETGSVVGEGQIGRYANGAGVTNTPIDNTHQVDGSGLIDFIEISFSQPSAVHQINLTYFHEDYSYVDWDCNFNWKTWKCDWSSEVVEVDRDDFRWMVDSSGDGAIGVGDWISNDISADPFSGFTGEFASVWGFGAFGSNDAWKLKTVDVKYDMAPIPLPAAGFLLLGGVGALGFLARRKKNEGA